MLFLVSYVVTVLQGFKVKINSKILVIIMFIIPYWSLADDITDEITNQSLETINECIKIRNDLLASYKEAKTLKSLAQDIPGQNMDLYNAEMNHFYKTLNEAAKIAEIYKAYCHNHP